MQRKTLLLINGSQVLMDLTRKILEREGYSVRCAVGVAGAQEHLMDFVPDGIILDNNLPDGKGLDYCRELRKKIAVPIMLLSNVKEHELLALQAGANDFLKKPFDYEIMKARINVILNTAVSLPPIIGDCDGTDHYSTIKESNEIERQQPQIQTEVVKEPVKKKRLIRRTVHITAACFMLLFVGIGSLAIRDNFTTDFEIPDEQIPLAEPLRPDENAKPYMGGAVNTIEGPGYLIPSYDSITFPADTENVQALLLNPEGNPCCFKFEIVLEETGETLYMSNLVEPGMYIEDLTLSRTLLRGRYKAALIISVYELGNLGAMTGARAELSLVVV